MSGISNYPSIELIRYYDKKYFPVTTWSVMEEETKERNKKMKKILTK